MKVLGIVPARGGSKGIPGKNVKLLCGKPLIQYTLEAAIESQLAKIVVSTDDEQVRRIALEIGVEVIERPEELCGDGVPTLPVLLHSLRSVSEIFDAVMTLQPTSPLRTVKHINESLKLFEQHPEADSLVSVVKVPHSFLPISLMTKDGLWLSHFMDEGIRISRRQEKPTFWARNGAAVYITRINRLAQYIVGGKILAYEMKQIESIDIDGMEDWEMAEVVMKYILEAE